MNVVEHLNLKVLESKKEVTFEEISALCENVGWGKNFHKSEENWQHVLVASKYIAYIKLNGKLISFGRILEDGVMSMFYDICVHKEFQKKGLGTLVMNHLIDKIKDGKYISIGLFVWEGNQKAADFYAKFGFKNVEAMELKKHMKSI